jgi:hypothetical protein
MQLFCLFFFFFEPSKVLIFSLLEIGFLSQLVPVSNFGWIDGKKLIIASSRRSLSVSRFGNDRSLEGTGS